MRGIPTAWTAVARAFGMVALIVLASTGGAIPPPGPEAVPEPLGSVRIRVDAGTQVTVYERTTDLNVLTYTVAVLMGSGGTYTSLAHEEYTFTSDGETLRIRCYRPDHQEGTRSGNNIAGARLDGVPGHPSGLWATTVVDYTLGYGGLADSRFNATGDDLGDHTYMGDQSSELLLAFDVEADENESPAIASFTAAVAPEGGETTLTVSATDPDGDPLTYSFDFEADGVVDSVQSSGTSAHRYGDDFDGAARVVVSDGALNTQAQTAVRVENVAPGITALARAVVAADVTLRVAGERWHDVTFSVSAGGTPQRLLSVLRVPGSPDEQAAVARGVEFDLSNGPLLGVVEYTPDDDPLNGRRWGANPAWLIFRGEGGEEIRLHHTFNVRHPGTWRWEVADIGAYLAGLPIRFEASAEDPGSDDLTFTWDWGDGGTDRTTHYWDGQGPDPFPSLDLGPAVVSETRFHAYAARGTYTVTLTVTDDDGGSASRTLTVRL